MNFTQPLIIDRSRFSGSTFPCTVCGACGSIPKAGRECFSETKKTLGTTGTSLDPEASCFPAIHQRATGRGVHMSVSPPYDRLSTRLTVDGGSRWVSPFRTTISLGNRAAEGNHAGRRTYSVRPPFHPQVERHASGAVRAGHLPDRA